MKLLRTNRILILLMIIITISACKDIVDTDVNRVGMKKDGGIGNPELLEFRFDLDGLTYHNDDTTKLWSVIKPSNWAKTFNIRFLGNDSIIITDIAMLHSKDFNVFALNALPIILKPNEIKPDDVIMLELKTTNLAPGVYIDKVIINKDSSSGFFIRIKVN